jgi:hypothetical protein
VSIHYRYSCSFTFGRPLELKRPRVEDLIRNIKNTLSLQYLSLLQFIINLEDLEPLHAGAPNLKELDFEYSKLDSWPATPPYASANFFSGYLDREEGISLKPAVNLETFKILTNYSIKEHEKNFIRRLKYIGQKYLNIQHLTITTPVNITRGQVGEDTIAPIGILLEKALKNMPNIKKYEVKMQHPITDKIMAAMAAMDSNSNTQLKQVKLWTNESNVEKQLKALQCSRQADNLEVLSIKDLVITTRRTYTY